MKRIVIIDPDFESLGGHNINMNEIIRAHTKAPIDLVCSSALSDDIALDGVTLRRVLPFSSYDAHSRSRSLLHRGRMQWQRFARRKSDAEVDETGFGFELLRIFRSMNISASDSIVVHTGAAVTLNAIMDALGKIAEVDWPVLHFRQLRPLENVSYARPTHRRLRRLQELGKLFMYAETNAFASKLATLGYDHSAVDIVELSDISQPLNRRPDPAEEFKVAMLGTVRLEKGYRQLAPITRSYRAIADRLGGPQLKLVIQTGAIKNRKLYQTMLDGLEEAGINFELADAHTGLAGHWRCLQRCHAVIMPYDRRRYIERGSGIGIDSVATARPLVVVGNCTLEEYIRNGNGLAATGTQQMAEALYEIASNYSVFAGNAMELATKFRKVQTQSPLFRRLNSFGPGGDEAGHHNAS